MSLIDVKGKKVHYIEMNPQGEKTIVLIHGLFTGLSVYFYYIAPRLAKRYRVILYDLRSHGLSERRDEGYTLEILMDDLLCLMDALNIQKADLVGYSYGGAIALYTAMQHPEKVRRLALIEATLLNEWVDGHLISEDMSIETLEDGLKNHRSALGFTLTDSQIEKVVSRNRCLFENDLLPDAFRHGSKLLSEAPMEGLSLPVLLLYGRHSDQRVAGDVLVRRISSAKLYIGNGDHNLPIQRGHWVGRHLKSFFKQHRE